MKSRYITIISLAVTLAAGLTSCIDDSSSYGGNDIPSLSITVPDADKLPEVNFNYGEDCVITPTVNYSGTGNLTYEWSVATYHNNVKGNFEIVSDQPVFNYFFKEGGSYLAHLRVTDGIVGCVQEYQVNINRTFEQGYLIVANDDHGIGNLTFIKDRTAEEIEAETPATIMEHCLERVNDGVISENLAGALILQLSWPKTATRVVVSTGTRSYFLDPNTFVSAVTIDYTTVYPGFKAQQFLGDAANARAYDPSTGKYVTLNAADMFGYEESDFIGRKFDVVFSGSYTAWGNTNFEHYFVKRSPLEIWAHAYYIEPDGWGSSASLTDADGYPLFKDEELVVAFMGEGIPGQWGNSYPCYVISRNKNTDAYYTTYLTGFDAYSFGMGLSSREKMTVSASTAIPAAESTVVPSETYHRTYYYSGSRVYVALMEHNTFILPDRDQYCLSYPDGEEVTYLTVNTSTDELIVATRNTSTGRGSIYIYNIADVRTNNPNATPVASYPSCTDRVSQILYKPRVANV